MSVLKLAGWALALMSLVACAGDAEDDTTAETTSHLNDPGLGDDVPTPQLPPGPWSDPQWKAPPTPDREHDPVGPEGTCGLAYQKIYDPARSRYIEVPVVLCE